MAKESGVASVQCACSKCGKAYSIPISELEGRHYQPLESCAISLRCVSCGQQILVVKKDNGIAFEGAAQLPVARGENAPMLVFFAEKAREDVKYSGSSNTVRFECDDCYESYFEPSRDPLKYYTFEDARLSLIINSKYKTICCGDCKSISAIFVSERIVYRLDDEYGSTGDARPNVLPKNHVLPDVVELKWGDLDCVSKGHKIADFDESSKICPKCGSAGWKKVEIHFDFD